MRSTVRFAALFTVLLGLAACGGADSRLSGAEGAWEFRLDSYRPWKGTLTLEPPNADGDIAGLVHIEDLIEPGTRSFNGQAGGIYSGDLIVLRTNVTGFYPWSIIAKIENEGNELRGYALGSGFEAAPFVAKRLQPQ